jgi:hypothetical protein
MFGWLYRFKYAQTDDIIKYMTYVTYVFVFNISIYIFTNCRSHIYVYRATEAFFVL